MDHAEKFLNYAFNLPLCFQGSGILGSSVLQGMVFKKNVEGTLNRAEKAKIAVYSCPVDSSHTETKVRQSLYATNTTFLQQMPPDIYLFISWIY